MGASALEHPVWSVLMGWAWRSKNCPSNMVAVTCTNTFYIYSRICLTHAQEMKQTQVWLQITNKYRGRGRLSTESHFIYFLSFAEYLLFFLFFLHVCRKRCAHSDSPLDEDLWEQEVKVILVYFMRKWLNGFEEDFQTRSIKPLEVSWSTIIILSLLWALHSRKHQGNGKELDVPSTWTSLFPRKW